VKKFLKLVEMSKIGKNRARHFLEGGLKSVEMSEIGNNI
jgi:hypothetical protein